MGFSTWMRLQLMDALSAVRSERILASQMHLPATLNLQSPNKFVRIQIGRVQTHFKIKIATPGESGHAASLRGAAQCAMQCAIVSQLHDGLSPAYQISLAVAL